MSPPPSGARKRLLLVGWDAADWKFLNPLLDAGEMPFLNHMVETGSVGDLLTCKPWTAAAQWTSVATGKRPWQHGITHSRELPPQGQSPVPISRPPRRCAALWEMLAQRGIHSLAVGWPATHGTQADGLCLVSDRYSEPTAPPGVKPWPPALKGTYWPEALGRSLDPLRVSPLDLGADIIGRYIPNWQKIDQQRDRRLGQLRLLLAIDFCHYAAFTHLAQREAWSFAAVRFPALGHLARLFMPFHPPRREGIPEADFALYRDVMRVECRMLDQALAGLAKLAGPEAGLILVSAHGTRRLEGTAGGFPSQDDIGWKSPYGMLAAGGLGFSRDLLVHGASVLDIAPTVLCWFGLPLGEDMEGRVLVEAFAAMPDIQRVESWEKPDAPRPQPESAPAPRSPVAEQLQHESEWNLVQSLLEAGRLEAALGPLQELFRAFPERLEFSQALFDCQLQLEKLNDAETTLELLLENLPSGPSALLPRAELALAKRQVREARNLVDEVRRANPTNPVLLRRLGLLLLALREWKALADLARMALKSDETDPLVWLALAESSLRLQQPAEAEQAAQRAIQLKYFMPDAHFVLARALVAQNKWAAARETMAGLLTLQPDNKAVAGYHRRLQRNSK